ncbi:MAG: hypothetical protein FWD30_04055 [Dehalococcoidia bacterium]|nr:hypothetical protein [Dehalococcoidia bacterium]
MALHRGILKHRGKALVYKLQSAKIPLVIESQKNTGVVLGVPVAPIFSKIDKNQNNMVEIQ